jgi:hypothetical protein
MKNRSMPSPGLLLAAILLLVITGCSKERSAPPVVVQSSSSPAPATPAASPAIAVAPVAAADPCAEMKTALAAATLEQHDGLAGIQQRMDQDIDAQVASRKAAADVSLASDKKLDAATEDFAEKLRMLSVARSETWNSAKHDAELALQNVSSAFAEVMSSPLRK